MPFLYPTEKGFVLTGKTLVVPVVSTANISQLATDLLISTFSLRQIGSFDSRDLVPIVGGREDGRKGVTTALELYGREGLNVVVIHQRSPALKSRKQEFIDSLLNFVNEIKFASVLFLSGVDLSNRTDSQMFTPTYYLRPMNGPSLESSPLASIAQLPIPQYTSSAPQRSQYSESPSQEVGMAPFIPGGGLTRRILSTLPSTWSIPVVALLQFVLEGDNRADAHLFAAVVAKVLGLELSEQGWIQPLSWNEGLFGRPHDQTLYG